MPNLAGARCQESKTEAEHLCLWGDQWAYLERAAEQ